MGTRANTGKSSYGQVLSIGPFRFLWFGQVASQLAINSLLFILALRLYQTTGSNTAVSGLFLAYGIPSVLFGLIAGTAVDHLDKRRVLMYCDIVRAVLVLLLFFISGDIALVYLVMFVSAVITQFYVPAEAPTIPKLVPAQLLVTANSLFSFTYYSSLAVGSILAGPLLKLVGPQWIFPLISFFFAVAATLESNLPSMAAGVLGFRTIFSYELQRVVTRMGQKLSEGLTYVKKSHVLLDSLILLTGTQIIMVMLGTLGPGYADRVLHIDIRDTSLYIVGPAVLGILAGTLWVGAFGYRFAKSVLIATGVTTAGAALLAVSFIMRWRGVGLGVAVSFFFILGFANSILDVPANSLLQGEATGAMRGRVYGLLSAAVGGVGMLPVFAGGILADVVGVRIVLFLLGLILFGYGLFRMRYNRTI